MSGPSKFHQGCVTPFHGTQIVLSENILEPYRVAVPRSWKERLLTRPWKPLVKMRYEVRYRPDPHYYVDEAGRWVMHPQTFHNVETLLLSRAKGRA